MIDKQSDNWQQLPLLLKVWFVVNYLQRRPSRKVARRIEVMSHVTGFLFCCLGIISEPALVGGLIMLASAYLLHFLKWQGDKYGIWYDHITEPQV